MKPWPLIMEHDVTVRAILSGCKTQDRRILNPQPPIGAPVTVDPWEPGTTVFEPGQWGVYREGTPPGKWGLESVADCLRGKPGDLFQLQEAWAPSRLFSLVKASDVPAETRFLGELIGPTEVFYQADGDSEEVDEWYSAESMPFWASRAILTVTGLRAERLQDISEEDALAEGIREVTKDGQVKKYCVYDQGDVSSTSWQDMPRKAVEAFAAHWDLLNAELGYPWASNPWVWVREFTSTKLKRLKELPQVLELIAKEFEG